MSASNLVEAGSLKFGGYLIRNWNGVVGEITLKVTFLLYIPCIPYVYRLTVLQFSIKTIHITS